PARSAIPRVASRSSAFWTALRLGTPAASRGTAAFSAAVSAGSRLYCWNTNPRIFLRNAICCPPSSLSISWPSTITSPALALVNPVITERRVGLSQPLGPTSTVIAPQRTSRSTPRRANSFPPPFPNSLRTSRHWTAISESISLPSEDRCRFQNQDPTDADQARHADH